MTGEKMTAAVSHTMKSIYVFTWHNHTYCYVAQPSFIYPDIEMIPIRSPLSTRLAFLPRTPLGARTFPPFFNMKRSVLLQPCPPISHRTARRALWRHAYFHRGFFRGISSQVLTLQQLSGGRILTFLCTYRALSGSSNTETRRQFCH